MSLEGAIAAAAGALLVAVLNELRARSAARTARLERDAALAEMQIQARATRAAVDDLKDSQ